MTACPHTPKYPDLSSIPSLEECQSRCKLVEDDPKVAEQRALTSKDGQTTRIDAPYWQKLSDAQRAAVIAHERAHPAIGMEIDCEGCADKVGGFYMRAWGYAPAVVTRAYSDLHVARRYEHGNIVDNATEGANAAERGLAARGLLGKTSAQTALALRAAAKKATDTATSAGRTPLAASTKEPTAPSPSDTKAQPASPSVAASRLAGVAVQAAEGESKLAEANAAAQETPNADGSLLPAPPSDPERIVITDPSFGTTPSPSPTAPPASDIAGDVVSAVLGESARPHAGKVLLGAGLAATLALVLVIIVRRT